MDEKRNTFGKCENGLISILDSIFKNEQAEVKKKRSHNALSDSLELYIHQNNYVGLHLNFFNLE